MTREEELELYFLRLMDSSNESFFPLFWDEHRYLVLKGGAGSGKSIFAGRKKLERATTEKEARFLVCRKVANTLRESCFAQLREQIAEHYNPADWTINKAEMSFAHRGGGQIITAGLDDVEKLKSIYRINSIWVEEASELEEKDLKQLDIRMRGFYSGVKQIILSFNPISATHWLKKRFFDNPDPKALIHESTYKDNRFLDEEQKALLESFKETDPYYYMVYCLNQWGVSGVTVFDAEKVTKRLSEIESMPYREGYFDYSVKDGKPDNPRFVEQKNGPIRIFKDVEKGHPYVIGGDTAGEGSDYFTAQVLNNSTGEQVAMLRQQKMDEDLYAWQLFCIGTYFNTALIGVESNFSPHTSKELQRLHYPKQFVRQKEDNYTGKLDDSFGFRTTQVTRPLIIADLVRIVRENVEMINCRQTLEEMLTFVRNEKGRPEAQKGSHDDLIMALAIAYYIRTQQRSHVLLGKGEKVEWREDQKEDYRRASAEDKKLLRRIWGDPVSIN